MALYHHPGWVGLLPGCLGLLSGIAVKTIGVDCRDVTADALGHLLALRLAQTGPCRADRQPRHRSDVKAASNDRIELGEPAPLPKRPAVLHRVEQSVVEAPHGVTATRRRGVDRIGNHTET